MAVGINYNIYYDHAVQGGCDEPNNKVINDPEGLIPWESGAALASVLEQIAGHCTCSKCGGSLVPSFGFKVP